MSCCGRAFDEHFGHYSSESTTTPWLGDVSAAESSVVTRYDGIEEEVGCCILQLNAQGTLRVWAFAGVPSGFLPGICRKFAGMAAPAADFHAGPKW